MAYRETHLLVLDKLAERNLNEGIRIKHRDGLLKSVNNRGLFLAGYEIETDDDKHSEGLRMEELPSGGYKAYMYLRIVYNSSSDKPADTAVLRGIAKNVYSRGAAPSLGRWTLSCYDDEEYILPDPDDLTVSEGFMGYAEVHFPDNWEEYFSHLYGLDAQVKLVRRAIEAGIMTSWNHRAHAVLIGPPGCGKSDLAGSLKAAIGEEAVAEYDCTAMTAPGIIKDLSEKEVLPQIAIFEEIEKSQERSIQPLLAIMDQRGEIRKITARQSIQRDTKLFCIATVNNEAQFRTMAEGALADRFSTPIYFDYPSRDQLGLILNREIIKAGGDLSWRDPTLDYCEAVGITHPRRIISICLSGREMLLTGEYQQLLSATSKRTADAAAMMAEDSWSGDDEDEYELEGAQ